MELPDIKKYITSRKEGKQKIDNERQEAIHNVMALMGEDYKKNSKISIERYRYWNGRLKKYSPSEIRELIEKAKNGKNPPALFNWLIKKNK